MIASSKSEFYDTEEEDDAQMGDMINEGLKHAYGDETWTQQSFTYVSKPKAFIGRRDTMQSFEHFPTILQLFEFFWPFNIIRKIVIETNHYATKRIDATRNTRGGAKWENLTMARFKAFLAIQMYMGMKKQPNYKTYWEKEGSIFHCPIISNIMTWERFMELHRYLHITNLATYEHIQKGDPKYDKVRQIRWLLDEIRNACMREWSLGKYLTIDEMMVRYKGSYSPIRQ
jgi:hypothetical protein